MAGHSKWSKVKRIKGPLDVKRGAMFSKLVKEISVAARVGGGDPEGNPRLRSVIETARAQNMPKDNIERAIKKGTGELEGAHFEEATYEGYAPGGVAVIVEAATDNKNRTAADLRSIFSKNHGSIAAPGSVSYMFHKKGQFVIPRGATEEERLLELTLDAGAEDLQAEAEYFVLTAPPDRFYAVGEALKKGGVTPESQKLTFVPDITVAVNDEPTAAQVLRLYEALDEHEDIQHVYSNFDIPEDLLARLET
ncbi:MAG: YebC/PmpR family DNA-binding transcriptional regulator [Verrucomicrobia bacterium]|nr:YebC/PmpR family DNA-binding transcriptional regulator [Verrucomicrobiota bacterium]MBV9657680.1 YebC/PmpR family DNA-binding transcriptional regulator [Verrucomicrobiota bacterium]